MALQKGCAVYIMGAYNLGPSIAKYLGAKGETAFVEIPVRFSYGIVPYEFEVPKKALLELPKVELDW